MAVRHHHNQRDCPKDWVFWSWLLSLNTDIAEFGLPIVPVWIVLTSRSKLPSASLISTKAQIPNNDRASLTNRATQPISTLIWLVITTIKSSTLTLVNLTSIQSFDEHYVDVTLSDGFRLLGEESV